MSDVADIVVVGAGMVGAATALQLQRLGRKVILVDRQPPGSETSYGNAGVISGLNIQITIPRHPLQLAQLLLNRVPYFRQNLFALPSTLPWLWAFWRASSDSNLWRIALQSQPLFSNAIAEHLCLASLSRASHLLRDVGYLSIIRDKAKLSAISRDKRLALACDYPFRIISTEEIAELEPFLKPGAAGGLYWPGTYHTQAPDQLVKAYVEALVRSGGEFRQMCVTKLRRHKNGTWDVESLNDTIQSRNVVISAGPWSKKLLEPLGYNLPLGSKRGYHLHFQPKDGASLTRPVKDDEYGFVLSPMDQGIRLCVGVELDHFDAPASDMLVKGVLGPARELFPIAEPLESSPWLGRRPTFPDQLPMIGAAPGHQGLWFNFGHGHYGLTLGPTSGKLLAEMIDKRVLSMDPAPFAPLRSFRPRAAVKSMG
ncbi:FAD-dependent oxidoreductase [Mesorhizobium sp. M1399]|uniref:NAD(P)/FAD-dependent oxidoreductase n=1 Tax=Mesorhizobium sp. M1399 TaxID=2957096 RepID=UPI00333D07E4